MAFQLIWTLGGEESNSLLSVAEADAYFEASFESEEWADFDSDTKAKALVVATRHFSELSWWGERLTTTQALDFPRYLLGVCDGTYIPRTVRDALCEHALDLARAQANTSAAQSSSKRARLRADGVTSYRIGDLSETFSAPTSSAALGGAEKLAQFSPRVQRLLGDWVRRGFRTDSGRRTGKRLWWPEELGG